MEKKGIFNPATWTERDREFLDAVEQLDSEQQDFILWLLEYANAADPEKQKRMNEYVHQMEGTPINTAEDRAAFKEKMYSI